ncbi:hypothetical protein ACFPRL_28970 [Pseudoclavibacter helvolus]
MDAPDGTAARPVDPSSSRTSTSTVGLPRESRISRAWTTSIRATGCSLRISSVRTARDAVLCQCIGAGGT